MYFSEYLSKVNKDRTSYPPANAVFLGDSVTQGVFEISVNNDNRFDYTFDYTAVYHNQLKYMLNKVLPSVPINIINAGINGGNASQGLLRLEKDVLNYSPSLVVVCFGLNDVHGGGQGIDLYIEALTNIFRKLKYRNIETIFMTPNMMNTYVCSTIKDGLIAEIAGRTAELQNDGTMDFYMDSAKKVCMKEGIVLCDSYSKWKQMYSKGIDITSLLANRINHPDREMHKLFAALLLDLILFA